MTPEVMTLLVASAISTVASVWAGAKALQSAYRSAVNRRATEIENQRLADASKETVTELEGQVADLKDEVAHLWQWLEQERRKVDELRGRLDGGSP